MKTISKINVLKMSLILVLIITLFNCNKNDDSNPSPTVAYLTNDIEAVFYNAGNTTPTVNWNGDIGAFQLIESYTGGIPGLSLNETTGEISWSNLLKEGIWIFDVEATNSAGTTIIEITIDNTLQGVFNGTYTFGIDHPFLFEFYKDGTVTVIADSAESESGTWTINNASEILVNYTFSSGLEYSTLGTLIQTDTETSYNGIWFNGHNAINEVNVFQTDYTTI